jgi:hypothetical protein
MNTNYADSIRMAVQHAVDSDLPIDLMPLTISQDASMLAGLDSDRIGCAAWD